MEYDEEIARLIPWLKRKAAYYTKDKMQIDDLVGETILKALSGKDKYNNEKPIKPWLDAILCNTYLSYYKSWENRHVIREEVEYCSVSDSHTASGIYLREIHEAIERCLVKSHRSTETLLMHVEGYTYEEISKACGLSMGTVKSRISHARLQLRKELAIKS